MTMTMMDPEIQDAITRVHRSNRRCQDICEEIERLEEARRRAADIGNCAEAYCRDHMDPEDFRDEFGYYPEEEA